MLTIGIGGMISLVLRWISSKLLYKFDYHRGRPLVQSRGDCCLAIKQTGLPSSALLLNVCNMSVYERMIVYPFVEFDNQR